MAFIYHLKFFLKRNLYNITNIALIICILIGCILIHGYTNSRIINYNSDDIDMVSCAQIELKQEFSVKEQEVLTDKSTSCLKSSKIINVNNLPRNFTINTKKYPDVYKNLTALEIKYIESVVQHEAGNMDYDFRRFIAGTIYNRYISQQPVFGLTIKHILFKENQYTAIENYYTKEFIVDNLTRDAVKDVFTNGCPEINGAEFYHDESVSDQNYVYQMKHDKSMIKTYEYTGFYLSDEMCTATTVFYKQIFEED